MDTEPEKKNGSPVGRAFNWLAAGMAKSTKLIKALKGVKIMLSMFSFIAFAFCQSAINGFAIGFGITIMLLIHELGHVGAMARRGMEVKLPIFIPFLGAAIVSKQMLGLDRPTEAYVGYGGPLIGTVASWILGVVALCYGSPILLAIAVMGVFLNLFNMIPLSPMDGGRITQSIHPWAIYVGALLLVLITLLMRDPGLLLIWIITVGSLDKLTFLFRFYLTLGLYVLMVTLFIVHPDITRNTVIEAWIDSFTGAMLTLFSYAALSVKGSEDEEIYKQSGRPYPPTPVKVQWACIWILTVVLQIFSLTYFAAHLPSNAKKTPNSTVLAT